MCGCSWRTPCCSWGTASSSTRNSPPRGSALAQEPGDAFRDLVALVLLEEVPRSDYGLRGTGTGDQLGHPLRRLRAEDGIGIREEHERGLLPGPELIADAAHRACRRMLVSRRHELGEYQYARFRFGHRPGGVVGLDHLG